MKICFTLDDGLKTQVNFWNKTLVPSTYFILPDATEVISHYGRKELNILTWGDVRLLAKHNEIGFHGYSSKYEGWGEDKVKRVILSQMDIFEQEVGYKPVSFAYTDMKAFQLSLISSIFPYIRDYFWRDKKGEKEYLLRIPETPEKLKPYIDKIFCVHPSTDIVVFCRYLKSLRLKGTEYCIIILHEITDHIIQLARIIGNTYDTVTFREIFEKEIK